MAISREDRGAKAGVLWKQTLMPKSSPTAPTWTGVAHGVAPTATPYGMRPEEVTVQKKEVGVQQKGDIVLAGHGKQQAAASQMKAASATGVTDIASRHATYTRMEAEANHFEQAATNKDYAKSRGMVTGNSPNSQYAKRANSLNSMSVEGYRAEMSANATKAKAQADSALQAAAKTSSAKKKKNRWDDGGH